MITKRVNKGRYNSYFALTKVFQGLGFMISFDNPIIYNDYILIDLRFLYIRLWISYNYCKKKS